jgi:hypothetical protein
MSASQWSTHYSAAGNGDVLDIVVQKHIWLSEVSVSEIVDSDHIPTVFRMLDHIRIRNISDQVDKLIDWERFQSLASDLI